MGGTVGLLATAQPGPTSLTPALSPSANHPCPQGVGLREGSLVPKLHSLEA